MNRLGSATSPYLLQHADNPVDWWPWGPAAFAEARRRDVPVLISIGYSACHWCHVMAHESFEDGAIAALVNDAVVPVKVDREERPDVDAVYLTATRLMAGQAGWPMTVFATPEGEPFFCGTYLPPTTFASLVRAVADAWNERRPEVLQQGRVVVDAVARANAAGRGMVAAGGPAAAGGMVAAGGMSARVLDAAAASLLASFDRVNGGFGGAPKFPPHMELLFLLRHHQRTGDPAALDVVRRTCEAMARGGLADQVAGGFARYAVDATWTVPHFEKMLYDNALLLRVYTGLWRLTGDRFAERVATGIVTFLADALRTPEGGLAAALDANTDRVEGLTYAWTPAQLREVLGEADGEWAIRLFAVTDTGTFEHGTSVLQLPADPDDPVRYERVLRALTTARAARPQPARHKVVAAWNNLAATALVEYAGHAAAVGGAFTAAAEAAGALAVAVGELLAGVHLVGGRLYRVSRGGAVGTPAGVLDDHGCVAEAFCALHQYTGEGRWLRLAEEILDVAVVRFGDGDGGYFDTADDAESLVARPADPTDNATPSGTSALAAALVTAAALTGRQRYRAAAQLALATLAPIAAAHGRMTGYACAAGEALLAGPYELAIAPTAGRDDPLAAAALRRLPPGAVLVCGRRSPGCAGRPPDARGRAHGVRLPGPCL
jgi:uncharacterized protein YyaL (SSP411 family)